jgi:hypothetical protein
LCKIGVEIVNHGYFSESIELLRGDKQGCPLSPYLFIMAIEMLAIKITSRGKEQKVSVYADDSSFYINTN